MSYGTLHIILSNNLVIHNCSKIVNDFLKEKLTLDNPEYQKALKLGFSVWGKSEKLFYFDFFKDADGNFRTKVPRGILASLFVFLQQNNITFTFEDKRPGFEPVVYEKEIKLRPYQEVPVQNLVNMQQGVLVAPAGSGKTVMILDTIRRKQMNAFIAVHTSELLNQFKDRAIQYLGLQPEEIGIISEGKVDIKPKMTIALIQTLAKLDESEIQNMTANFGITVIDECHHVPADSFLTFAKNVCSRNFFGATATLKRTDGLDKVLEYYLGPVLHEIHKEELQDNNLLIKPTLIPRFTQFTCIHLYDEWKKKRTKANYGAILAELVLDPNRNRMIIEDVLNEISNGGYVIVLSKRREHLKTLFDLMPESDFNGKPVNKMILVSGSVKKKDKDDTKNKINNKEIHVMFAIDKLAGEGLDIPHLTSVMLATPVGNLKDVEQYAGRVSRTHEGKVEARIYDYIDQDNGYMNGILWNSFKNRYWGYYKTYCNSPVINFNAKQNS